jgi:hypothetical protein
MWLTILLDNGCWTVFCQGLSLAKLQNWRFWFCHRFVDAPKKLVSTPSSPQPGTAVREAPEASDAGPSADLADSLHAHHIAGGIAVEEYDSASEEDDMGLGMLAD